LLQISTIDDAPEMAIPPIPVADSARATVLHGRVTSAKGSGTNFRATLR
jgi:hypothetical protein